MREIRKGEDEKTEGEDKFEDSDCSQDKRFDFLRDRVVEMGSPLELDEPRLEVELVT